MGEAADAVEQRTDAEAAQTSQDPEEIRAQIEQTRAEMSDTIEAIQERLSPSYIKDQAIDTVKDATEAAKEAARAAVQEAFSQGKQALHSATIGRVEDMANYASNTARSKGNGLMARIRENPVPAALAAIGIGWLLFKGGDDENDYDYDENATYRSQRNMYTGESRGYSGEYRGYGGQYGRATSYEEEGRLSQVTGKVGDVAGSAKHAVTGAASTAADTVTGAASTAADAVTGAASTAAHAVSGAASNVAHTVGDVASDVGDRAVDMRYATLRRARRAKGGFQQMLQDNPMAVGAIAIALGTAIGIAAPGTEKERELMGEMRDNLMDKAQTFAQEKLDQVAGVAQETLSTAKDELQTAAENVKTVAKEEARSQGLAPNQGQQGGQGQNQPTGQGAGQSRF